jgi:hypothetical protein
VTLPDQRVQTTGDTDKTWDFGKAVNGLVVMKAAMFPWTRCGVEGLVFAVIGLVRVRVTLRLTVYRQSIRLGDKPLETHDQNFYFPTEHLLS